MGTRCRAPPSRDAKFFRRSNPLVPVPRLPEVSRTFVVEMMRLRAAGALLTRHDRLETGPGTARLGGLRAVLDPTASPRGPRCRLTALHVRVTKQSSGEVGSQSATGAGS